MDGNGASKGDNQNCLLLSEKPQLDGSWSYQAQLRALDSCNPVEDLTFKESSVKDVSDAGRGQGAAKIQRVLTEVSSALAQPASKRQKTNHGISPQELEVCQEVCALMQQLQHFRNEGASSVQSKAVVDVLLLLKTLPINVACLKKTKIAAELNQPFWRGESISADVQKFASFLVRTWRNMYKAETEDAGPNGMSASILARTLKGLSSDLEESIYGHHPKIVQYTEHVDAVCERIRDNRITEGLMAGSIKSKEFVKLVVDSVKKRHEQQRHGQPRLK